MGTGKQSGKRKRAGAAVMISEVTKKRYEKALALSAALREISEDILQAWEKGEWPEARDIERLREILRS